MIRQVIGFDDLIASEIYTPRMDVEAVPVASAIEEVDRKFTETGFSRLPVFQDSIDNILGIIHFKDFYREVMKGERPLGLRPLGLRPTGLRPLNEIIKPVVFVAKTIKIGKLLRTLQEKQAHIAVVIDEHGGVLGIITIEDIVEELVGEIWDENEKVIEPVKKLSDGGYRVLCNVNFSDMLELIDSKGKAASAAVSDEETEAIPDTTIANWIMERLGRLPRTGEKLTWRGLTVIVTRVLRHRVMEVKVSEKI
jgi:CBS domain containing-hemolysin-like protein